MPQTRIGISGWTYAPWRGVFYPKGLSQKQELSYASRALNSIEINGTFYSLQRPSSFQTWYEQTPDDFLFSVKGPRFITHIKKLGGVETALANFFASGVLALGEKLGPILWQLPPQLGFQSDRIEAFLEMLPRDTQEAVNVAKRHDDRLKGRNYLKTDAKRPLRHAMEVRHETFRTPAFVEMLRTHDVALVNADTAGKWPHMEDVTADFVYARLHGDEQLYVSGYTDAALDRWAAKFKRWQSGVEPKDAECVLDKPAKRVASRDVYVYFDNDVKVCSPRDAAGLAKRLGVKAQDPDEILNPADVKPGETAREHWPAVKRPVPSRKRRPPRV
jgi:uncharacterized protein YecE (DUF72 family)